MALRLENVSIADRAVISDIITESNWGDPYGQTVWEGTTKDGRYAGSYARLPKTLLAEGNWFMKCIDTTTDQTIAYAQWTLPVKIWQRLRDEHGGGIQAEVTPEMRKQFEKEHNATVKADGDPIGLRDEVIEHVTPPVREANATAFPKGVEYIMLVQVKTLPEHQRRGAGQLLTEWGNELADREGLKTCLEATPFGVRLYEKCGFETKAEGTVDVSNFGGPSEYTWKMMIREPKVVK